MDIDNTALKSLLTRLGLEQFDLIGFTSAQQPRSIDIYSQWLADGKHGDMGYLERHLERKKDPQKLLSGAKSWIVMATYYDTAEPLSTEVAEKLKREKKGWVSRYARGRDYHLEIGEKMNTYIAQLQKQFPNEKFLPCVDIKAVLERDTAERAGLGWIGKNTCLINQKTGSFIFISEILTTMDIQSDKAVMDHCGTCTRCLDACPTGALTSARNLDSRLCISYWTIESKCSPPPALSSRFTHHVYGCDICQDVCPWNQKARRGDKLPASSDFTLSTLDLRSFVKLTHEQVEKLIEGTALERAGAEKLLENARVALVNLNQK